MEISEEKWVPRALRWAMIFWPGLAVAWESGSFRALGITLVFALALQTAWVGTFVWPALLRDWETSLLWWSIALAVLGSVIYQTCHIAWASHSDAGRCSNLALQEAQAYYLQGSFFEAEQLLTPYVSQGEWDVEAALWLASIYRRTGRFEAATMVLQTIETLERASLWAAEISQEHRKIKESRRNKRIESI